MANTTACGLNELMKRLTGTVSVEQSAMVSPVVFDQWINIITSLLLSKLAAEYPTNQQVIDILDPFVERKVIAITDGYIQLPSNYRNLLGSPFIYSKQDGSGECGEGKIVIDTPSEFRTANLKAGCRATPIVIVPQSEFAYRTQSTYDFPTYSAPIGYFSGKKQIKVCPYDLARADVLYIRNEKIYRYGYIPQPDDTFLFDEATTEDTEWTGAAFTPIYNALIALYAAYNQNPELTNWSQVLNERGIL